MASKAKHADLKLVRTDQSPVQIHGEQGRLYGTLNLQNRGTDRLSLRSIPIEAAKIRNKDAVSLSELRVRGRLSPKEQGQVYIDYEIDPTTPPGVYAAKLMIGGESQDAEINIAESAELDMTPDTVVLNLAAQPQLRRDFRVTNIGNVDVQLGDKLVVPVRSDCMLETAIKRGLNGFTTERSKNELKLSEVLLAIGEQLAGPITLSWTKATIRPGESMIISTKIELPDGLHAHSYYYAEVELYGGSVHIDVYT